MAGFALVPVRLRSREDLARLACALEKIPKPIIALRKGNGYLVGTMGEGVGEDRSLFFYHEEQEVGDYLCYRLSEGREAAYYSQEASPLPALCSPVVRLAGLPISGARADGRRRGVLPVEAEDLQSVAKMGLYRAALDESPEVLYFAPCSPDVLGSFVRASEEDGPLLFLRYKHPDPSHPYLKVNPSRAGRPEFVAEPREPGYVYMKVVRLGECPDFLSASGRPDEGPSD